MTNDNHQTEIANAANGDKAISDFADKVFESVLATQSVQAAYLGDKLGWYKALAASESPMSSSELADATSSSERYAREWLEQQTVTGWITCEDPKALPRKFSLPRAHAEILANPDSLNYMLPLVSFQAGLGKSMDAMVKAYETDGGVSWDEMGNDQREYQAALNRPVFLQVLGKKIFKGIPEINKALSSTDNEPKVADIGAGYGWASIGVAEAFPYAHVDAYDLDAPSIDEAKKNIAKYGLEDRAKAHCIDAAVVADDLDKPYDVVMALECIHDLSHPISVLKSMKKLAGDNGFVLVMDEKVQEEFTGTTDNPVEAYMFGVSCTCCLLDGKSGGPDSAATGTVMRPALLKAYAQQAGFSNMKILDVDHDFFRFYQLIQ